ncbi:sensor domain-containing protein [Paenibacillus sonchi]|uniref:Sensor domain-containing protein n=1 Tax=Paenibacillus sonchi TaxID=373687 RepID=A0A974P913_9BACL|nr:sensor domain-containing protein [Paenibacillus sonchi]QQZ59550.1 sensor domain-containing protein [Paenibacillus sonchi]
MNNKVYTMPIGAQESVQIPAQSQSKPRKGGTNPKVFRSIMYFIISVPLTIVYFVFMVTGLALSIGLTPVFIGIPLFFAVAKGMDYIVQFEQELVRSLLDIPEPSEEHRSNMQVEGAGFMQRMKLGFHAGKFARNIMLIMGRFVSSIVFFSLMITVVAAALGLITLPVLHQVFLQTMDLNILENSVFALFQIDWTLSQQYISYVVAGFVVALIANWVIRKLMDIQRRMLFVSYDEGQQY